MLLGYFFSLSVTINFSQRQMNKETIVRTLMQSIKVLNYTSPTIEKQIDNFLIGNVNKKLLRHLEINVKLTQGAIDEPGQPRVATKNSYPSNLIDKFESLEYINEELNINWFYELKKVEEISNIEETKEEELTEDEFNELEDLL